MSEDPQVGIVMGSDSDWPTMRAAAEALEEFGVPYEADVVSAHRMPEEMLAYGKEAAGRGLRVHLYGKDVKPGRKVGHVTAYGEDLEEVRERALHAAAWFRGDLGEESE